MTKWVPTINTGSKTIQELQTESEAVSTISQLTGADLTELVANTESRYNISRDTNCQISGDIIGIPLSDWCKENNLNRYDVFQYLYKIGWVDWEDNSITLKIIEELAEIDMDSEEIEISISKDLTLFNTYVSASGKYVIMVNPISDGYALFKEEIKSNVKTKYCGSKSFSKNRICKVMYRLFKSELSLDANACGKKLIVNK